MSGQIISDAVSIKISGGAAISGNGVTGSYTLLTTAANEYATGTIRFEYSAVYLSGTPSGIGQIKINSAIISSIETFINGQIVSDGFIDVIVPPSSTLSVNSGGLADATNSSWKLSYVKFTNSP